MIRKILHYFYKFIVNPKRASEEIAEDESGLWAGLWWVIIFCICYSVTVFVFYLLGHVPVTTPFLPIPLEKWYLIQTFTTIPVGLAGFLSYSGLAYLLCKGQRRFRPNICFSSIYPLHTHFHLLRNCYTSIYCVTDLE